jgi:hypothetical protein
MRIVYGRRLPRNSPNIPCVGAGCYCDMTFRTDTGAAVLPQAWRM